MATKNDTLTPMMRQYRRIRSELADDVILLFRLGDFYEMFFEDAQIAAPILNVALTKRGGVPMCGVPYHALDGYLSKLILAGRKAALCEQMEDPATTKGIVRREVTRIVTPGTIIEHEMLDAARNNYLAAIYRSRTYGLALLDLSTGEFAVEELDNSNALRDLLRRYAPSECLIGNELYADAEIAPLLTASGIKTITATDDWLFEPDIARDRLLRHFGVHSLDGFGCEGRAALIGPAGALLHYVSEELHHNGNHIRHLQVLHNADILMLDEATCSNLDLLPGPVKAKEATLFGVLDNTLTPMGARLLRSWILRPLCKKDPIDQRLDAIETLVKNRKLLNTLRQHLNDVRDLERLITRIDAGRCNGRDLQALATSLVPIPTLREAIGENNQELLSQIAADLQALPELVELIERAIVEAPPIGIKDGGIFKAGFNADLDALRQLAGEGRQWLAKYQAQEQERTGIKTLKVRHNRVFGYYIEVSKGQANAVPPEYERRQTLVNAERFITPELKNYEQSIFGAQDKAIALELELFNQIRDQVAAQTAIIQRTAAAVALIDVIATLADRALALDYVRPDFVDGDILEIKDGRHAIIEQLPDAERFVPNDTILDCNRQQIAIITGPNMAGKSTYIRQVALIAIMAHIGSFVPARKTRLGLIDRVFTRVGAGDDLARGRSTFMVEMQEAANILNNATPRSLIILDEIGRGTSTFDGISIAWAVAEYLHNTSSVKAKTLFATHYHELTDLAMTLNGVRNYSVQVRESGNGIVFLRKIELGAADKSYGIHVARLAGMPAPVLDRAREILENLEDAEFESGIPKLAQKRRKRIVEHPGQLTLF